MVRVLFPTKTPRYVPEQAALLMNVFSVVRGALRIADDNHMIYDALLPYQIQPQSIATLSMASATAHYILLFTDLVHYRPPGRAVHQQHGTTIQLLNQALASPVTATELPVLAAIVCIMGDHVRESYRRLDKSLTLIQFILGSDMHEFDVHEAGAHRIISLRGGLGSSLMENCLRLMFDLYVFEPCSCS